MSTTHKKHEFILVTDKNFDEVAYLASNPDVARAVIDGSMKSGKKHFERFGRNEMRKIRACYLQSNYPHENREYTYDNCESHPEQPLSDNHFLAPDVPMSQMISHQKWLAYLFAIGNKEGMRILEIGSREVTSESHARKGFSNAEYVGFDFYPGKNVDVVGDAHKLSSYFEEEPKFDIIYSSACFEHFALPWIVAAEIAKLLKVGGIVFIETHFSFSSHERPWHFFQFSDMALKVLFSQALGFQCLEAGMSNPIIGRFSSLADEYLRNKPVTGLYCHSEYLGKKVKDIDHFEWKNVDLIDVVGETQYPEPKFLGSETESMELSTQ